MKYKLTENTKNYYGDTLYQIEALKSFNGITKGDLGGRIQKESNLSQYGDAWVYGDALVYGDAKVFGNAKVFGDAKIEKSTDIITFNFGEFLCTATRSDKSVVIGCQRKTIEEWLTYDFTQAVNIGLEENYDYELYKSFVQMCSIRFRKLDRMGL